MKTIDGCQLANREDLIEHSGYSLATLVALWKERETNGHPPARQVAGVMHWDLDIWSSWFKEVMQQRTRDDSGVDRGGDPDEELSPKDQARVLGVDPSRITQYDKKPPPGWPEPVRVEQLPTRTRAYRTRRQLWNFADTSPTFGTLGGRPHGPDPKTQAAKAETPDPRIQKAAEALRDLPGRTAGEVAAALAECHGGSVYTWKRIVTQARASRPDIQ